MARKQSSQAADASAFPLLREESARYASRVKATAFPLSAFYAALHCPAVDRLRDTDRRTRGFEWTERHVQAVWHDPQLRPTRLVTSEGEVVDVEHPGIWNLAAGPDFTGAVLRVGSERRRLAGDVEIHIHPSDWSRHGHQHDKRYASVRFHVTYFAGRFEASDFPPGTLHLSLHKLLDQNPRFSFDTIDVTAYPYAARATRPPCQGALKTYTPDERQFVLASAGQERLRRKAERLSKAMDEKGADQVVYEEVMTALGYKNNKQPFRHLTAVLPYDVLRATGTPHATRTYALLMGLSGLLPAEIRTGWDNETRLYIRSLWRFWWRYQDRYGASVLGPDPWRMDGLRPSNHPHRRLMAAALLFSRTPSLASCWKEKAVSACDAGMAMQSVWRDLTTIGDPYWSHRLTLGGKVATKAKAILGAERAAAIGLNIVLPFWAAIGKSDAFIQECLMHMPPEPESSRVKQTAHDLFGRDHAPSLYRAPVCKQGLLQIFHDFCLPDRTKCASCPLPELLLQAKQIQTG